MSFGLDGFPYSDYFGNNPACVRFIRNVDNHLAGEQIYTSGTHAENLIKKGFVKRIASFTKENNIYKLIWNEE